MPQLNPNYVLEPFHNLIGACQTNVLLGLRLAEEVEIFPSPTAEERTRFQLRFLQPATDFSESKARFRRWLILKSLGDIHQCIGAALQRFIVFRTLDAELAVDSALDIEVRERALSGSLRSLSYPDLVQRANRLCSAPLIMDRQIGTFNNARNCLEHSGGVVVKRFCNNPQKDKLTIQGRRIKLFFLRENEEIPAVIGRPGPENAALMMGAEDFDIEFAIGEPVELSSAHFMDILNTCVFFRADIEEKLRSSAPESRGPGVAQADAGI
jgi:hypothetical protein